MKIEKNNSTNKFADVPLRVKTWVYIILVFSAGISHPILMNFFVSWIGFQVIFEFLRMFKINKLQYIFPIILAIFLFVSFHFLDFQRFLYTIIIFATASVFLFFILKTTYKQLFGIALGLLISLFVFPHLFFIRESQFGVKALLFLVLITEVNDVFQYLMGKFFGKHKITPIISPNKTWEGFVGGVFLTLILSNILGSFLLPFGILINSILGLLLGIFGFFGDIFMSFIKRKAAIKDTGNLLPSHGGLLDRMDSLLINAPLFFWILPFISQF